MPLAISGRLDPANVAGAATKRPVPREGCGSARAAGRVPAVAEVRRRSPDHARESRLELAPRPLRRLPHPLLPSALLRAIAILYMTVAASPTSVLDPLQSVGRVTSLPVPERRVMPRGPTPEATSAPGEPARGAAGTRSQAGVAPGGSLLLASGSAISGEAGGHRGSVHGSRRK